MVKPLNPNPKIGNKGLTYYQRKYDRPKFQIDTPPLVNTTLPNPKILSATAAPASRNLILRSAKPGDPEPYVYGYTAVRPMVIAADDSADTLVLDLLWSVGEISQIEGPYLYIPDVGSVDVAGGTSPLLHEHFLGTAGQSASSIMTALKGSYDTLAGKAHSVVSMQVGWNLNLMGFIYGRLIRDPRLSPTSTKAYSANPALILADVLTLCGYTMDWDSVATAASYCDELTGTDSPQDKRWEIGLVINTRESLQAWVSTLASYCSCYVDVQGSSVALIPDKPRASSFTYTAADMLEGTCRVRKRGARNAPDAVRVIFKSFIDRTFETVYPGATSPETTFAPGTISTLNMPGWNDFARAKRKAEEVYRKAQSDTEVEFVTFDKGLLPALGDVCTITNAAYGLSSATFILTESEEIERGRWRLTFGQKYDVSHYSSAQYSGSSNTTQLYNPYYPPPGPTPTLTADLVTSTSPNYYRIKIDFSPTTWAYLQDYKVNTYIDGVPGTILHSEYPAKGSETGSPETITVYADLTDSPGFQMSIGNSPQTVYRVDVYNRSLWTNQDGTEVLSATPGTATVTDPVTAYTTTAKEIGDQSSPVSNYYVSSQPASPTVYEGLIPATSSTDYYEDFTLVFCVYTVSIPSSINFFNVFDSASSQYFTIGCSGLLWSGGPGAMVVSCRDSANVVQQATVYPAGSPITPQVFKTGQWMAVMISRDGDSSASPQTHNVKIRVADVGTPGTSDVYNGAMKSGVVDQNIATLRPMGSAAAYVGRNFNRPGLNCYISHVWCKEEYLDPATYWTSFFDSDNKPIDLGADGSTPTGVAPESFFPDGDFTNNRGTGPNWTEVGTVPAAPSSPTD